MSDFGSPSGELSGERSYRRFSRRVRGRAPSPFESTQSIFLYGPEDLEDELGVLSDLNISSSSQSEFSFEMA